VKDIDKIQTTDKADTETEMKTEKIQNKYGKEVNTQKNKGIIV
jgi:hypothetical protein